MSDTYIGKGRVYIGPYADNAKRRYVGSVSSLVVAPEEDVKEIIDSSTTGGGLLNELRRMNRLNLTLVLDELTADNVALALLGTAAAITTTPVSAEAHTAYQGGIVTTAKMIDTGQTVTVTGTGGTPTYTVTTDYVVRAAGIEIVTGGGISDSTAIEVSYTPDAGSRVQVAVNTAQEYKLTIDGLNEAESGRPVVIEIHRVKFGPGQDLSWIGDEFQQTTINGQALKDSAITGAGLSPFMRVDLAS